MPRPPALRWDNQRNKWKVVYQGKKYRFDGGSGKSDRNAKRNAELEWKQLRTRIDHDTERSKPHRIEYDKVMAEWNAVLEWCVENGDEKEAAVARSKLGSLAERLAQKSPPPLDWADRFLAGPPPDYEEMRRTEHLYREAGIPQPMSMTGPKSTSEETLWRDRLETRAYRLNQLGDKVDDSLSANVQSFLDVKNAEASVGQISIGRAESIRIHLEMLMKYLGRATTVQTLSHSTVASFRKHLLEQVRAGQFSDAQARDTFSTFRQFVRWLGNHTDKLEHLPKNLDDRTLAISVSIRESKILSKQSIYALLRAATDRTRLYILLGLNAAMTQKDMSDLSVTEVDWVNGTIRRKRSKTRDCKSVPEVTYTLWPETFRLLKEQRAANSPTVLVNEHGKALTSEFRADDGKYKKSDAVRLAIKRLSQKTGIAFSIKALKKTTASLLRNSSNYHGLESLFLGHSPTTVSDRHYTQVPGQLFSEALAWACRELGLDRKISELPSEPESANTLGAK